MARREILIYEVIADVVTNLEECGVRPLSAIDVRRHPVISDIGAQAARLPPGRLYKCENLTNITGARDASNKTTDYI